MSKCGEKERLKFVFTQKYRGIPAILCIVDFDESHGAEVFALFRAPHDVHVGQAARKAATSSDTPCEKYRTARSRSIDETVCLGFSRAANEGDRMLNRIKPCYNSKCKYNSDCVCSLRKKSCAWRVKQERSFNDYVSLARSSDDVKLRDRNKEAGDTMC